MLVVLAALCCRFRFSQGLTEAGTDAATDTGKEARKGVVAGRSIAWSFG